MRLILHPRVYSDIDKIKEYYGQTATPDLADELVGWSYSRSLPPIPRLKKILAILNRQTLSAKMSVYRLMPMTMNEPIVKNTALRSWVFAVPRA